jgi:hypothetical protein
MDTFGDSFFTASLEQPAVKRTEETINIKGKTIVFIYNKYL